MTDPIGPSASDQAASVGFNALGKARPQDDPEKIVSAARQFEGLLIGQMMKSMHDSDGGWLGTGDDESASSAMEYGQEIFAQAMAQSGGLGLANLIAKGLQDSSKTS
jgi:Rod binding domain-containing protein